MRRRFVAIDDTRPIAKQSRPATRGRRLPAGTSFAGKTHPASDVKILADTTWVDSGGTRHCDQEIFDDVFELIGRARKLVLLDMFLYNDFRMRTPSPQRELSGELTNALLRKKREWPDIEIVVITDPINTVYGSVPSDYFRRLRREGIIVVTTDLSALRDSNTLYSSIWRLLIRPFGNSGRGFLPNPFDGSGRMTFRSFFEMLNFKANHRKVLIADDGDELKCLVGSANAHDASSAHTNVAVRFNGRAASDLLGTENSVLRFCGQEPVGGIPPADCGDSPTTVQVLTESAIKVAALEMIDGSDPTDRLDLAAFYLSDRDIIHALIAAQRRKVLLRILLDPNNDAFGHRKFGIPNRPVAAELHKAGLHLRWCHTHGEQCHVKMLMRSTRYGDGLVLLGSANLTRRNLDDLNLETNVLIHGSAGSAAFSDARAYFDMLWHNGSGRMITVPYARYRDESRFKKYVYRFMEASGMCTF